MVKNNARETKKSFFKRKFAKTPIGKVSVMPSCQKRQKWLFFGKDVHLSVLFLFVNRHLCEGIVKNGSAKNSQAIEEA